MALTQHPQSEESGDTRHDKRLVPLAEAVLAEWSRDSRVRFDAPVCRGGSSVTRGRVAGDLRYSEFALPSRGTIFRSLKKPLSVLYGILVDDCDERMHDTSQILLENMLIKRRLTLSLHDSDAVFPTKLRSRLPDPVGLPS